MCFLLCPDYQTPFQDTLSLCEWNWKLKATCWTCAAIVGFKPIFRREWKPNTISIDKTTKSTITSLQNLLAKDFERRKRRLKAIPKQVRISKPREKQASYLSPIRIMNPNRPEHSIQKGKWKTPHHGGVFTQEAKLRLQVQLQSFPYGHRVLHGVQCGPSNEKLFFLSWRRSGQM